MPSDYSAQNLRGRSFRGQNLEGANFSYADIRSADFSGAILIGANFNHVKAGLQKRWAIFLVLVSWVLMGLSGFLSASVGSLIMDIMKPIFNTDKNDQIPPFIEKNYYEIFYPILDKNTQIMEQSVGWTILVILVIFFFVTIRKGIQAGLRDFAVAVAVVVAVTVAVAVAFTVAITFLKAFNVAFLEAITRAFIEAFTRAGAFTGAVAVALAVAVAFFGAFFGAVAVAVAVAGSGAFAVAVALALAVAGSGVLAFALAFALAVALAAGAGAKDLAVAVAIVLAVAVAVAVAGSGAFAVAVALALAVAGSGVLAFALAFALAVALAAGAGAKDLAVAVAIVLLSTYISWRALKGDPKHALICDIAVAFAAFKGTSFRSADLTDADLTGATLKSTDFRKANLTRTCWQNTQKLERVRFGTTYLQNATLRQVLVTGRGEKQIFDQQNLRGVNLRTANLQDASFIATDLSEANLQDADLSRTKLVQTQLDQTDLTGAILTGAYIEEWNISTDTKLHGVRCDYVFMRLPPERRPNFLALPPEERLDENPRRKPDDWNTNFTDGEFADFIAPLLQTLDLYHNQVVDPRFIAIAFQQLKEAHPEAELEIISIEKKGKNRDKIHIKAESSLQADSSTLHADYFSSLDYLQSLPPQAQQALLVDRGAMIRMLAGLLGSTSTPHPEISIVNNNLQTQENENQNEPRNINIDDGNYNEDIKGNYVQGDSLNIVETPIPVLHQTKCTKCGYKNHHNSKFCTQCGAQIVD